MLLHLKIKIHLCDKFQSKIKTRLGEILMENGIFIEFDFDYSAQ